MIDKAQIMDEIRRVNGYVHKGEDDIYHLRSGRQYLEICLEEDQVLVNIGAYTTDMSLEDCITSIQTLNSLWKAFCERGYANLPFNFLDEDLLSDSKRYEIRVPITCQRDLGKLVEDIHDVSMAVLGMKKVALVYCGDNPLCKLVEREFSGMIQKSISIRPDDPMISDCKLKKYFMYSLAEEYDFVLTDNTLSTTLYDDNGEVCLYRILEESSFEEWFEDVQAVIAHYRNQGRNLAINAYGLSDHMWITIPQEARDQFKEENDKFAWLFRQLENKVDSAFIQQSKIEASAMVDSMIGSYLDSLLESASAIAKDLTREAESQKKRYEENAYLAHLLGKITHIPVIPYDSLFRFSTRSGGMGIFGDAQAALQKMGLDSKNTVVLIDHHAATYPSERDLTTSGFGQLALYPIDPCCIGRREQVDTFSTYKRSKGKCKIEQAVVNDRYTEQIFEKVRALLSS